MKRSLRRLFRDVFKFENIDLIVIVLLVFIVLPLDILGIAPPQAVPSVTLAALGLMAISLLIVRHKIENIYVDRDLGNSVQLLIKQSPLLVNDFKTAKEFWMIGLTLRGTTTDNFYSFREKVSEGTKIHTLIVNPSKVDMDKVAKRFSRAATAEQFRSDFAQTINQYREIAQAANNANNVQLRLMDFVPSFSLYIFPGMEDGGIIYVEIFGYKSPMGSVPRFRITEQENRMWYKHFINQFETIWQDAEVFSLKQS